MALFENFPYTDMHQLNLDWIVKTVKEFQDQYTHIQELIDNGELTITNATTQGLTQLEEKQTELENLLDQWYTTHSADIVNELSNAVASFAEQANTIINEIIQSIPQDYSVLSANVQKLEQINNRLFTQIINTDITAFLTWEQGGYGSIPNYLDPEPNSSSTRIRGEIILSSPVDFLKIQPINHDFVYACFDASGNALDSIVTWRSDAIEIYKNGIKTIRISVRNSDNSNISPQLGYNAISFITNEFIDFKTINEKLKTLEAAIIASDNNYSFDFYQGGYGSINNYSDPEPNNSNTRIRTEKIIDCPNGIIIEPNTGFDFTYAVFDSNDMDIDHIVTWRSTAIELNVLDCKTLRIAVRRSDNSDITPSVNAVTVKPIFNNHIKFKVCSFNLGHFSYGVSPYYLNNNFNEKLSNYKKFFEELDCDIFGFQENNTFLDSATEGQYTTNDYIYNYLAPFFSQIENNNAIKSRIRIYNKGSGNLPVSGRSYVYGTIRIDNKNIFLACAHFTPNAGSSEEAARIAERDFMINLMKQHKYAVIMCDFNAQTTAFYDEFINQGLKIANGGYKPFKFTYSYDPADFNSDTPSSNIRYFDNIITTDNIVISNVTVHNTYDALSSDHIPISAELTILD